MCLVIFHHHFIFVVYSKKSQNVIFSCFLHPNQSQACKNEKLIPETTISVENSIAQTPVAQKRTHSDMEIGRFLTTHEILEEFESGMA
jgi:hypothetical protein